MESDLILPELSYRVIGCLYEVHNTLGAGLLETSYQESLAIELRLRGIACRRETLVELEYKGQRIQGFRLDLVVEDQIVVECKTVDSFPSVPSGAASQLSPREWPSSRPSAAIRH